MTITTENQIVFPTGEFWSDEPPLESNLHLQQIILLIQCLKWLWKERQDYFVAGNLTIYYSPNQKKSEYFRGPDFFLVLDTTCDWSRKSWVVWQEEGKYPNVIVEILSDSTAKVDREEKKQIYQDTFRTPEYFWFDPDSLEFKGFELIKGKYQEIHPNSTGLLKSEQLGLYLGIYQQQLRYFTLEGALVPTPEEDAQRERENAQRERERAEKLAAKLRELGVNPDLDL
ncbi:MAG: Uma2 family endonuclease [Gloeocapsa sp. DLM2.Bin57]|nr:MAG: Uma2 family endonuclease [Gloeocapsa sp. DLM2.Bin57]